MTTKKRIIITGTSGFVGSNLKAHLGPFYEIETLKARFVSNQIFNLEAEAIVHLAGKAHDLKNCSCPEEYYYANFELTKQLFDAFLISKATIFIFMSSVKAVADEVEGILKEDFIPNPKTHYGSSKLMAENYILNRQLPAGKKVYILRPSMIHGPGNKGNLNLLFAIVSKGIPWPLAAFHNKRSFLGIDNLCFVIKELLDNNTILSGVYNLSDNQVVSTNEIIVQISNSKNSKPRMVSIPKKIIVIFARIGDLFHLPLNSERLKKLTESYIVSNDKIIKAIGKPFPFSAVEGFKKTFQSFRYDQ
jgi:nucleoside-diphosphate-sugar epimerase